MVIKSQGTSWSLMELLCFFTFPATETNLRASSTAREGWGWGWGLILRGGLLLELEGPSLIIPRWQQGWVWKMLCACWACFAPNSCLSSLLWIHKGSTHGLRIFAQRLGCCWLGNRGFFGAWSWIVLLFQCKTLAVYLLYFDFRLSDPVSVSTVILSGLISSKTWLFDLNMTTVPVVRWPLSGMSCCYVVFLVLRFGLKCWTLSSCLTLEFKARRKQGTASCTRMLLFKKLTKRR